MARHHFQIGRTIARVNNPRNERLFQMLGIEATVSAAAAVLAQIEVDLPEQAFIPLVKLRASGLEVVDLHVQGAAAAAGVALRDLELPDRTTISLVINGEGASVPDGDTVLQPGDEIIAIIDQRAEPEMRALVSAPPTQAAPREPAP